MSPKHKSYKTKHTESHLNSVTGAAATENRSSEADSSSMNSGLAVPLIRPMTVQEITRQLHLENNNVQT